MNTNTTAATALPTAAATVDTAAEAVVAEPKPRRRRLGFRTHVRAGAGKGDVC